MPELHDSMVRPEQAEATRKLLERGFPVREATVIRPGDHLIVRVEGTISRDRAAEYRDLLREKLPLLADVTVIQADGLYVIRDDAGEV